MDANYNLGGLVNRVKARLKDADYSESDITQFINDAYFEVLGEAHYQFLEKYYESATQGAGFLLLPPDFQTTVHLTASKGENYVQPLVYLDSRDYFNAAPGSALNNYRYTIFGGRLLYALPDISEDLDADGEEQFYTLRLYYLAKPVVMVQTTDKPLIPAEYGEILVLMALARAEQLRDNFDFAMIYQNKADELITNMKLRYNPRQLEGENRARLPIVQKLRY